MFWEQLLALSQSEAPNPVAWSVLPEHNSKIEIILLILVRLINWLSGHLCLHEMAEHCITIWWSDLIASYAHQWWAEINRLAHGDRSQDLTDFYFAFQYTCLQYRLRGGWVHISCSTCRRNTNGRSSPIGKGQNSTTRCFVWVVMLERGIRISSRSLWRKAEGTTKPADFSLIIKILELWEQRKLNKIISDYHPSVDSLAPIVGD